MTQTQTHTPGPWHFTDGTNPVDFATYKSPGYYDNLELRGPNDEFIVGCDEYDVWGYDASRQANAHLIAAAPELLAALKAGYAALGMIDDFGTAANQNPDIQNRALDTMQAAIARAEGRTP